MHKPVPAMPEPMSIEAELKMREENVKYDQRSCEIASRIQSHDAAGYESAMMNFSEFDDGYGNNTPSGDLSVQRMVEESRYGAINKAGYVTPIDTEPYMSRSQQRYMHAAADRGEISKSTVKEYDEKTDFSHLPERKHKK